MSKKIKLFDTLNNQKQFYNGRFREVKATIVRDLFNASGKVWFDDLSFIRTS